MSEENYNTEYMRKRRQDADFRENENERARKRYEASPDRRRNSAVITNELNALSSMVNNNKCNSVAFMKHTLGALKPLILNVILDLQLLADMAEVGRMAEAFEE